MNSICLPIPSFTWPTFSHYPLHIYYLQQWHSVKLDLPLRGWETLEIMETTRIRECTQGHTLPAIRVGCVMFYIES